MLFDDSLATLTAQARRWGDRIAIRSEERSLSYTELDDRVGRFARHLREIGITPGDVVSVHGPTGWAWVVAYHGAMRAGAVVNPINALLTAVEVGFILDDCGSRLLIADRMRIDRVTVGMGVLGRPSLAIEVIEGLTADGPLLPPQTAEPGGLSTICYTSGTTGRPKGAMLSHRAVQLNAGLTAIMHGRTAEDVVVTALPLAHVYGNVVMNGTLLTGGTLVLLPAFDAEAVIAAIATHAATRFEGVPTMYYYLLEAAGLAAAALDTIQICTVGGQSMPAEKMAEVERRLGCPLVELWGMSEIAGLGTTFPWTGPRILGSIGMPMPTIEARCVDPETGVPLSRGEVGEFQVRGPIVMMGYLNAPEATAEVLNADGWLSTGDMARIGESGEVYVVDRKKDVILTSGNNVYPAEVERIVAMHPAVAMVAVGRDPHPLKGEVPHAYVVLKAGATIDEAAIIEHCRAHLAPYKLPRAVSFIDELPRNSTGKVLRRMLRAAQAEV